jgi:hypothetical protein
VEPLSSTSPDCWLARAGSEPFTLPALWVTVSLTDSIGGVSPALIVGIGIVLFVVPEPVTSVLGALVLVLGLVWLFARRLG